MSTPNADRNAEIIAKRKAGIGPREIARRMSVSPNVVAGVINRHENPYIPKGTSKGIRQIERATAAVTRANEIGLSKAARELGIGVAQLCRWRQVIEGDAYVRRPRGRAA